MIVSFFFTPAPTASQEAVEPSVAERSITDLDIALGFYQPARREWFGWLRHIGW